MVLAACSEMNGFDTIPAIDHFPTWRSARVAERGS